VYCKTSLLPLSVKSDDCCLIGSVSMAFQGYLLQIATHPREYVLSPNS
jgi:hypothetical protein